MPKSKGPPAAAAPDRKKAIIYVPALVGRAYEIANESGIRLSGAERMHTLAVEKRGHAVEFGRVVGALAMTDPMNDDMSFSVVVDDDFQGAGVGAALVSVAVREAREFAAAGLLTRLSADVVNDDVMRPMLERRGFKKAGGRWMALDLSPRRERPYEPEEGAPVAGEWDRSGAELRWRQDHAELVRGALRSWKGHPVTMLADMKDEADGAPWPGSGTGKVWRAQAAALRWELAHRARPSPRALHRGSHLEPDGPQSWSESLAVAKTWAAKNGGRVFSRPKGTRGLRVADYTTSAFDDEREWVVDSG